MNRTSIEWTDFTWNPVTGCKHGCPYCYARRLAEGRLKGRFGYENGFEPTYHENRIHEPRKIKQPSKIFVCSMGDLFGNWVPRDWITRILIEISLNPKHQFQILTKNPSRLSLWRNIPKNTWLGTSIDGITGIERAMIVNDFNNFNVKFISFEPLLADVANLINIYDLNKIKWVIIGSQTGPNSIKPRKDWIKNLLFDCYEVGIPVFMKDNVEWNGNRPREFPDYTISG